MTPTAYYVIDHTRDPKLWGKRSIVLTKDEMSFGQTITSPLYSEKDIHEALEKLGDDNLIAQVKDVLGLPSADYPGGL
jgi:hypothetical protein